VESEKRGKRKGSADHFGPHPQILKKLAEAYHIPANDLFTRAGYLDERENAKGFSEERETDRLFDFVMNDASLKSIFTVGDKRAVINRYEALTGKRLITWAGEPDLHPSVQKPEFSGLRCENGMLFADTPHTDLTLEEVAQELAIDKEEVDKFIVNGWLDVRKDFHGKKVITKESLRGFKDYAMRDGLQLRHEYAKAQRPNTPKEFKEVKKRLDAIAEKELPDKIRQVGRALFERYKLKSK
jgi:hypothetical protein